MKKGMQKEEVSTKKPKAKDVRIDSAKKINTKSKMENAIFEKLTDHFIIMTGSMAEGTQDRV